MRHNNHKLGSNLEPHSRFSFSFSLSRDFLIFLLGFLLASGGFTLFIYLPQKPSESTSPRNSLSFSHLGEDLEA